MYRAQTFVERCQCREPATRGCAACGRARCERHLARDLCGRCTLAIGRELEVRSAGRWIAGGTSGAGFVLAALIAQTAGITIFGLPLGIGVYLALHAWQRRVLVRAMGPALAASRGELR